VTAITLPLYQRLGSCEPALCDAACCRFIAIEVNPIYLSQPDLAAWVRLHRIELVDVGGRALARIPFACSALNSDGRCSLYGKPERPQLCADYPMAPASLIGVEDVCTYSFTAGPGLALAVGKDSRQEAS
jgi:Fe-S-cluster containining protein